MEFIKEQYGPTRIKVHDKTYPIKMKPPLNVDSTQPYILKFKIDYYESNEEICELIDITANKEIPVGVINQLASNTRYIIHLIAIQNDEEFCQKIILHTKWRT